MASKRLAEMTEDELDEAGQRICDALRRELPPGPGVDGKCWWAFVMMDESGKCTVGSKLLPQQAATMLAAAAKIIGGQMDN